MLCQLTGLDSINLPSSTTSTATTQSLTKENVNKLPTGGRFSPSTKRWNNMANLLSSTILMRNEAIGKRSESIKPLRYTSEGGPVRWGSGRKMNETFLCFWGGKLICIQVLSLWPGNEWSSPGDRCLSVCVYERQCWCHASLNILRSLLMESMQTDIIDTYCAWPGL